MSGAYSSPTRARREVNKSIEAKRVIHPSANIHPKAKLDSSVSIGAYAVIDGDVEIGAGCVLGPHVYITGRTVIGRGNRFHAGTVIGDAPQDLKYDGTLTGVRIGDRNVFREHVTVHRSNKPEEETVIGSDCFLMANSHVAHNCVVGDHVIMANGALLGGHAVVQERAFISANCMVHQFARVGRLALMQGGSGVSKDLPPFMISTGNNIVCGLNIVGLRRSGITAAERLELKSLYHALFRKGLNLRAAVSAAAEVYLSGPARQVIEFIMEAKRGVCSDIGARGLGGAKRRQEAGGGENEL